MDVYFNFKETVLMMEPESQFEASFLSDLLAGRGKLLAEAYCTEGSTDVAFITLKPENLIAHTEPVVTEEEIDKLYEEMQDDTV